MRLKNYGVLAHLARARHWQCRGERFESAILHQQRIQNNSEFAVFVYGCVDAAEPGGSTAKVVELLKYGRLVPALSVRPVEVNAQIVRGVARRGCARGRGHSCGNGPMCGR